MAAHSGGGGVGTMGYILAKQYGKKKLDILPGKQMLIAFSSSWRWVEGGQYIYHIPMGIVTLKK